MRVPVHHNSGIGDARCIAASSHTHDHTDKRYAEFLDTAWVVAQSLLSVATAIGLIPLLVYLF